MLQLITPPSYAEFSDDLAEMYRLRHRVFKERLGWDVQALGDMEMDEYDALCPVYLLQRDRENHLTGCVRFLPTCEPNMLRDIFPALMGGQEAPASETIWESSRFAHDIAAVTEKGAGEIARPTYELFAGMVEFGLSRNLTEIVTVTDTRMERILRRASWPLRRIAEPLQIGNTLAVAGYLDVSRESLGRLRQAGFLKGPALWTPVIASIAA